MLSMSWSIYIPIFMKIRDKKFLSQKTPKGLDFKFFWVHPKINIYFTKIVDDDKWME